MAELWTTATRWLSAQLGSAIAFLAALALVLAWFIAGFWVGFDNTLYQLVINTGTTIITFLMVFILQNTQNRDTLAIQAKLDELLLATADARNELRGIEKLPDTELKRIVEEEP